MAHFLLKALRVRIRVHAISNIRIHVPNIRVTDISIDIILESLHAHAPDGPVGEVPHHGEQRCVDGQNRVLAATLGQSDQNAGRQCNKKSRQIDAHDQIHCIFIGEN